MPPSSCMFFSDFAVPWWMTCVCIISFVFIILGVHWASCICRSMFLVKFGKNSAIISSFFSSLSLFSFWGFGYICVRLFDTVLQFIETMFISSSLFSLCFSLDNFCWPVFKFINLFFCSAPSVVVLTQWIFISDIVLSCYSIFILFRLYISFGIPLLLIFYYIHPFFCKFSPMYYSYFTVLVCCFSTSLSSVGLILFIAFFVSHLCDLHA